jgi:hypothetical protein
MVNEYSYAYITGTTQVKTGRGVLHAIVVGETTATALQVIDNTAGSTTNLGELKASIAERTYIFDCIFTSGLRIVCGAGKYTVIFK